MPSRFGARQRLEEYWRNKLDEANAQYRATATSRRKVMEQEAQGAVRESCFLKGAREAEARALAHYVRVLRVYTDVIVSGKMPEERPRSDSTQE